VELSLAVPSVDEDDARHCTDYNGNDCAGDSDTEPVGLGGVFGTCVGGGVAQVERIHGVVEMGDTERDVGKG
jgi:hypothetical protein